MNDQDKERRTYEVGVSGSRVELRIGPKDEPYTTMVMTPKQAKELAHELFTAHEQAKQIVRFVK